MVQKPVTTSDLTVCVVGLGYVGLPLALAFGRSGVKTYGFDVNQRRVDELRTAIDATGELSKSEFASAKVIYSTDQADIKQANFVIVAVPTPVDALNKPDLSLVEKASEMVGRNIQPGSIVVYESTVYPGVTEEICAPILEKASGLKCGRDFKVGYSPERINPGDHEHSLEKIVKVVAGMDQASSDRIAEVYGLVCKAGVFRAKTIKTAEAAKVIENTQRDLNIALMNELSLIFHRLDIDTHDVLAAASTKWNFLQFTPGLVGGHCIGVDPYYLVQKALEVGYRPEVVTAGRRVNDYMPEFVADLCVRGLTEAKRDVAGARILVMGLTFKENVKDLRNSKIALTIKRLQQLGALVSGYDPLLTDSDITHEFGVTAVPDLQKTYDAVIIATPHQIFLQLQHQIMGAAGMRPVIIDVRHAFPEFKRSGVIYQSL